MINKEILELIDQMQGYALFDCGHGGQNNRIETELLKELIALRYQYYKLMGHWSDSEEEIKMILVPVLNNQEVLILDLLNFLLNKESLARLRVIVNPPDDNMYMKMYKEDSLKGALNMSAIQLVELFSPEQGKELILNAIERPANALGNFAFSKRGQLF